MNSLAPAAARRGAPHGGGIQGQLWRRGPAHAGPRAIQEALGAEAAQGLGVNAGGVVEAVRVCDSEPGVELGRSRSGSGGGLLPARLEVELGLGGCGERDSKGGRRQR